MERNDELGQRLVVDPDRACLRRRVSREVPAEVRDPDVLAVRARIHDALLHRHAPQSVPY